MLGPFFTLAARSQRRQHTLRLTTVLHLLTVACITAFLQYSGNVSRFLPLLGHTLFILAVIEGAVLIGWRLTQMPKSQSLEFLLVSPVQPRAVFRAEALTGLAQLFLVTLSSTPILIWLATQGVLFWEDVAMLLLHAFTWGAFTGLGLTMWAYEPAVVRKWGERIMIVGIVIYLVVGVLAGEKLGYWVRQLFGDYGNWVVTLFIGMHRYNPFSVTQDWFQWKPFVYFLRPEVVLVRALWMQAVATLLVVLFFIRSAWRLKGHFHERHYRPITEPKEKRRGTIGYRPLSWWSARRVMEYAGRTNIFVAGGFSTLYALYIIFAKQWPPTLGTGVFIIIERGMGGLPGIATGLVLLSAVPAAFQYGLWDSSIQERAKRMELLLLSGLDAWDYWFAALAAAWRRGWGYMISVVFLWTAGAISGRLTPEQLLGTVLASGVLWLFYFTLGFWAFARGVQANSLGSLLTLGLPLIAGILALGMGMPEAMVLVPPGFVFAAMSRELTWPWALAVLAYAAASLVLLRWTLQHADYFLRQWYNLNHGKKAEGAA